MLEGFVRQLILGYLGRYVKDIQKEQLKITLWNEEVLLENVELSLEAFDYLRLPFALKQGRVGKLSIKIPWMKLGWDPIVIILEDVFVCASQRDDEEWSAEAVGRREFAAKKAKLAAAELAKLSKRMCDNRAGRLFTSYISAKILDNIQVSMRGFHVVYHDMRADSVHTVFGLKFSSLTIMKQNPLGSSGAKIRGGQVNKTLEIAGLELYCSTYQGPLDILTMDSVRCKGAKCDSILAPCDVFMSLSVNRSGELDNNSPQHSINVRITDLEISLDEVQLQQVFILWDYLCTSQLREKYGRFRPWCTPLSKKLDGWQKLWWHYAQESVLLDVRKKLKKTSWRYFGQRLSYRHKYVSLYKAKLYSLQQDQSIDVNVLSELEQMEKELDIDDILSYRSAAESKLQEFLLNSSAVNTNVNGVGVSLDKSRNDEHLTGKSRGWLNWLSLGMLGAGGTDDSSQFSGVVSDEVIKDIYEATEFHPLNTSNVDAAANDEIYFCVIKFSIHRISTVLHSMKNNQEIAQLVLLGSVIECKLWESSATIVTSINSGEMLCPCNKKVLLLIKTPPNENKLLDSEHPSLKLQIDAFPNQDVEFLVKGLLEPVEVTYDAEVFLNLMEFLNVFNSLESLHQRILLSLNGIKDSNRRLQLKAEYILSSYEKVIWDFCINNILINVPWEHEVTGQWNLVLKVGKVVFTSKSAPGNRFLEDEKQAYALENLNLVSNSTVSMCFQLQDLNDHIEVKIKDIEMMIRTPSHSKPISILEKFSSSIMFTFCIVPDESILKQLEVFISVSSLHAYFSPSIYGAVLGFISHICTAQQRSLSENAETVESLSVTSNRPMFPDFGFCVHATFESVRLLVDLANDGENSLALNFLFQDLDIRYALTSFEECSICLKALNVTTSQLRGESDGYILYSSGNHFPTYSAEQQDIGRGYGDTIDKPTDRSLSTKGCLTFYYEYDIRSTELACRKFTLWLNDAEIHCYPSVIRLMIEFFETISAHYASLDVKNSVGSSVYGGHPQKVSGFGFEKFGFSNYLEAGSPEHANIPLDHFPFVTISDHCSLGNLESSLLYSSPDWRKYYNLRDRRTRTQQSSARKDPENLHFHAATPKSTAEVEVVHVTNNLGEIASSSFDLSICGIGLHFHDSSSIIGTVTLPSSSSSLFVHGDYLEALCSLEGLTLTSLWWTKNPHEFLWGPSLPDLSPIINFRIRKKDHSSSRSHFELGVSFQHVYCLLPPEYLAIIIGYFSLPDWSSDSNEKCKDQGNENVDAEDEGSIVYKFEILDSVLILPVESMELHFLKVDIHQLYCSFVDSCSSDNALKGIPPQYWVPSHKLAKRSNCLNIFGRDLFLSFLSFQDNASGCLRFDNDAMCENITILAPLSAEIWVRLPCENKFSSTSTLLTTCIMARLAECQVLVEDDRIFLGVEALLDVINQFSLVPDLSQCFKSDVLQFLQMKGCFKENSSASSVASSIALTELRCHIDSLFIKFSHSINGSSKTIAKAEMQFTLSATLKDDRLLSSDLHFSSLELLSLPNSAILARCTSPSSTVTVLDVSVWEGKEGKIELYLSFPSLDIWIHLSEWVDIIDTFVSYAGKLSKMSPLNTSSKNLSLERIDTLGNTVVTISPSSLSDSTCSASESMKQESIDFTVKLENICITFHFPIRVSNKACGEDLVAADQKELSPIVSSDLMEGSDYRYVSVTMQSKGSELLVDGKTTKLKAKMEKWSGTITVSEDKNTLSWPLFQIFHVFVEAEISHEMMKQSHVKVELRLDHLKVWLSHHFFYFWHGVTFIIPEAGSSQFPFGGIDFEVKMRKVSFLLSDGRWSCSGPLFEILVRNIVLHVNNIGNLLESLVTGEIQVNYNNIHKVFWEPFIEPWLFEINVTRKQELSLNSSIVTDIRLQSIAQLNLNFTEPLIECVFRTIEMIKGSLGIIEPSDASENQKLLNSPWKHLNAGRYAPYVLQNLTSLSLVYHVCKGPLDELDVSEMRDGNSVEPGASVPLHVTDTPEEQLFDVWPAHSSDRLTEQNLSGVAHHFISIQLDGTSVPSTPISMDRVGLTYLEADFSKVYNGDGDDNSVGNRSSFVVPVVFDVSVQRYSKLIRIYSTVILSNATSLPLELRFDIPFGVAPMILDPIYPGQELPLPLHLAEAGRIRWRPIGNSYLWSEVYNLANLLSQETKVGFLKSFVCYPTHPSSDPFRCCISVRNISLPEHGRHKNSSNIKNASNTPLKIGKNLRKPDESNKQCVHHLTLHTPLVVKNYLPKEVSLAIESGGVTNTAFLSEVETFFHNVDPWHDLGLEVHMHGFKPANMKFPRTEIFYTMAKFSGTKFTQTEIITFDPLISNGSMKITVEKMMDALSGVRELYIYVPFLLYNCIGFPLLLSDSDNEVNRVSCIIPSSYDISEQVYQARDGLSMLSSIHGAHATDQHRIGSFSSCHVISNRNNLSSHKQKFLSSVLVSDNSRKPNEQSSKINFESQRDSLYSKNRLSSSHAELNSRNSNFTGYEHEKVVACIYSPVSFSTDNELMVRVGRAHSEYVSENIPEFLWSSPFLLVPPSGSTTVLVPQSAPNSAYMISVTSSAVAGPLTGRSTAIIFQPRYIISNACSKDLCYKQKGTDQVFRLPVGKHSHLHKIDASRELLVSIRYNEPGWQWSGSFLPDDLGDTQVKMQNYVSGSSSMIQVEVQNADISVRDEKVVGSLRGNSGTILILLSDDDTEYMPYRIDNFSKERLRIFQQKCETFETIINAYTSCPYAWDEPCYPHRLTVEVPGERLLGSYSLDDVKEYSPICLQSSSEKPERKLVLSVHADGATKVLRVIDSNYHILDDKENSHAPHLRERSKREPKQDKVFHYKEKVSIVIPHLGISLINIHPQELLFACAKKITVELLQSLDQQKLSFQVSSLQIDNQLRSSPYPVMLSFDREYKSNPAERKLQRSSDCSFEPAIYIAVSKWRKEDLSLVSFEYIHLRVADFRLELEQEVILSLFDFLRNVTSRFLSRVVQLSDPSSRPLMLDTGLVESTLHAQTSEYQQKASVNDRHKHNQSLPSVVPIGAPWQQIYLLARRQRKIYVEAFEISPINITLSFSSAPWILRNGVLTSGESLIHRGLMALADVEGAQVHLKQLTIAHHIASWESIQEIVVRHFSRQLLHEMYKVFGSAGVIGNPMGFARALGLGLRDFLSVPARTIFESPTGLITGMAQGTTSLLSNTVYAISDAATQFSKAAHKGIVAFTYDDQAFLRMEQQQIGGASHSKGVINEVFEGLTGLLQLPIKGAEKHGLPGVLSGVALGVTGLVAKPAASILQVTGKTAQSIRNRSKLYQMRRQSFRVRFPRPLSREVPLGPYSWEEAVGKSMLAAAGDGLRFKDEVFVTCKALKQAGKFVVITERLIVIVSCSSLVDLGKPEFRGIPADLEWIVEEEIGLEGLMHVNTVQGVVHIVGSSADTLLRQNQQAKGGDGTNVRWKSPTIPFVQMNLELERSEEAESLLLVLLSTIEQGRDRGWGCRHLLHRNSIR